MTLSPSTTWQQKIFLALLAFASLASLLAAGYLAWQNLPSQSRLAQVQARGYLRCGVNGKLPGFSLQKTDADENGYYSDAQGFDADFCRAVAIAVFGTAKDKVRFKNLTSNEETATGRFRAVREGTVDLLIRNTSWTPSRDAEKGVDFGAITFFTYQTFMARKDMGIKTLEALTNKSICVLPGTTTRDNLEVLRERKIPFMEVVARENELFADNQAASDAFFRRQCDVLTSDYDQLRAHLATSPDPTDYEILDLAISDEMRGPAVGEDDSRWRDIVNYAAWATIYAEQLGITQTNVGSYTESASLSIKVFLGIDDARISQHFGVKLGIAPDFARKIVAELGNYEEIYQRNLREILPKRGLNQLWVLNHEGRLFSPAFVADQIPTPSPAP